MFGKPSTFIGHEEFGNGEMKPREIREPGSYYEYNDVRVNRFSLSLLRLWKRPLPDVLKTEIMDPSAPPTRGSGSAATTPTSGGRQDHEVGAADALGRPAWMARATTHDSAC
jgi:hypothetical protein